MTAHRARKVRERMWLSLRLPPKTRKFLADVLAYSVAMLPIGMSGFLLRSRLQKKQFIKISLSKQLGFSLGQAAFCDSSRGDSVRSGTTSSLISSAKSSSALAAAGCGLATGMPVKRAKRVLREGFRWK